MWLHLIRNSVDRNGCRPLVGSHVPTTATADPVVLAKENIRLESCDQTKNWRSLQKYDSNGNDSYGTWKVWVLEFQNLKNQGARESTSASQRQRTSTPSSCKCYCISWKDLDAMQDYSRNRLESLKLRWRFPKPSDFSGRAPRRINLKVPLESNGSNHSYSSSGVGLRRLLGPSSGCALE